MPPRHMTVILTVFLHRSRGQVRSPTRGYLPGQWNVTSLSVLSRHPMKDIGTRLCNIDVRL